MHSKLLQALAITVVAVVGCSGGQRAPGTVVSSSQSPVAASSQSSCGGTAIFDPVPALVCASLPSSAPAASFDALPGGYWNGRFLDETQAVQGYMEALVSEDGRFQVSAYRYNDNNLCTNWQSVLGGRMTTDGNAVTGDGRIVAVKPTLADGTRAADLLIDGVLAERDRLTGSWSASSGDSGCFELDYYDGTYYEVPSSLEYLVGDWNDYYSGARGRLTVDADGSLTGSDRFGCSWTGRFGLIDDRYSLYEFEAELRSCEQAGHYTGLAWHGNGWDPGEFWLRVLASDGDQALTLTFSNL